MCEAYDALVLTCKAPSCGALKIPDAAASTYLRPVSTPGVDPAEGNTDLRLPFDAENHNDRYSDRSVGWLGFGFAAAQSSGCDVAR